MGESYREPSRGGPHWRPVQCALPRLLGECPRDRKRYKVADYPKVTNRTKGLLRTRCVAGRTGVGRPCHTCLGRSQRSERLPMTRRNLAGALVAGVTAVLV